MPWEDAPLKNITNDNQLNSYKHHGFWQPMDTIREKSILEEMYQNGEAPWVRW
jgi:glucose-1-phosphate cytidylyltransferase